MPRTLRDMGRRRFVALGGGIVLVGAATIAGILVVEGAGDDDSRHGSAVNPMAMERNMARRLPEGWTGRVTPGDGGTYDVWLRHSGDAASAIRSIRAHDVVDIGKPAILTLLPKGAVQHTDFVFHLSDTAGDGELLRATAGPHHPGPTPTLVRAGRDYVQAEISMDMPTSMPTFTLDAPATS